MCLTPKIEQPQQFQTSKSPVYRPGATQSQAGRRGTILTGGSGIVTPASSTKKTLLGQ